MKVASVSIVLAGMLASATALPLKRPRLHLLRHSMAARPTPEPPKPPCAAPAMGWAATARIPKWPNLAGQSPAYVAEQLHLFKAKVRVNPVMQPIVDPLTTEDFQRSGRVLRRPDTGRAWKPILLIGRPARSCIERAIRRETFPLAARAMARSAAAT